MHERTPRPAIPEGARQDAWAITDLAATLHADARPAEDANLGVGHLLLLDTDGRVALELFPERGVVRLLGQGVALELTHQAPPRLRDGRVIFTTETSHSQSASPRLIVAAGGHSLLTLTHDPAPAATKSPRTRQSRSDRPTSRPGAVEAPAAPLVSPATPSLMPMERATGRKETRERLTLSGRVGTEPRLRTTRSGKLVATFPLAVRDDTDATTWHTIVAFDKRAEKVRDGLAKGQQVEIVGYQHERDRRDGEGKTRKVVEIYAAVVKPR